MELARLFNGLMDNMKHKAICYSKVSSDKNFTALIDRCLPMVQENRPRLCKCSTKHQLSIFLNSWKKDKFLDAFVDLN